MCYSNGASPPGVNSAVAASPAAAQAYSQSPQGYVRIDQNAGAGYAPPTGVGQTHTDAYNALLAAQQDAQKKALANQGGYGAWTYGGTQAGGQDATGAGGRDGMDPAGNGEVQGAEVGGEPSSGGGML